MSSLSFKRVITGGNPSLRKHPFPVFATSGHAGSGSPKAEATVENISKRLFLLSSVTTATTVFPSDVFAKGFQKRKRIKKIDPELYTPLDNGLKIYDIEVGKGQEIANGTRIQVHYDCKYGSIDVVSSRAARLLAGNRVIAEPFDFVAGEPIGTSSQKFDDRGGGGLFSNISGPKPPPALSTAVIGMKKGGRRSVIVPPELGYGSKGMQEIPPNTPFELQIEVLDIFS